MILKAKLDNKRLVVDSRNTLTFKFDKNLLFLFKNLGITSLAFKHA